MADEMKTAQNDTLDENVDAKQSQTVEPAPDESVEQNTASNDTVAEPEQSAPPEKIKSVKLEQQQQKKQHQQQKEKKPEKKVKRNRAREVFLELKNVTWPTFGKVVKQTATVLVVTVFFMLILLAMDQLLGLGYSALTDKLTASVATLIQNDFTLTNSVIGVGAVPLLI